MRRFQREVLGVKEQPEEQLAGQKRQREETKEAPELRIMVISHKKTIRKILNMLYITIIFAYSLLRKVKERFWYLTQQFMDSKLTFKEFSNQEIL